MTTSYYRLPIIGLALALWLITRPFSGIWHDSKFYTLQALHHLHPSVFSRDLFFLYGSQDQYSLFSHLHAAAIASGGLNPGTLVLQGLGLGLWFLAAWALTRILPGKLAAFALLLIVTASANYGSHGVFSYGEAFLTARLYAESLSLAGLAAWLSGRRTLGGMSFAVACAMHPLMALPALVIGLGVVLRTGVWIGLMGAATLLAFGLGAAGVTPFNGLLQPMDSTWLELVIARSPFVFWHTWEWEGLSRAVFVTVVTGTAWFTLSDGALRRLAGVTFACVLGAFAIAFLGGSLLKLPLIAGLQLPRVMWIGLVVTLILLVAMLWESRQGSVWDRVLALGLALGVFFGAGSQAGHALLVLAVFLLGKHKLPDYKPPTWLWLLLGLIPLQIILWSLLNVRAAAEWEDLLVEQTLWRIYFSAPAIALLLLTAAYWLFGRGSPSQYVKWAGGAVVAGLLGFALLTWYELRPQLNYDSPERQAEIAPVVARVPEHATVYWVDEPDKAWFWLGRSNYLSFSQTAGSVFSRGAAIEALRRAPYVRPASLRDSTQSWNDRNQARYSRFLPLTVVEHVCGDPILDYVIGRSRPQTGTVHFKDPHTGTVYRLYDCRVFRDEDATESSINAVDVHERVKKPS